MQESKRKLLNFIFGKKCEYIAVKYVKAQGYVVLSRNFRYKGGEIDIIAKNGNVLIFVEVKGRRNLSFGSAKEAVDQNKQKRIIEGSKLFMLKNNLNENDYNIRFDVITIENNKIEWLQDAFA
ncbi:MAG: YraN family protein [Desulfurella sp.]|uniref:YraN family protein n=1 Tax=Desulfurella sp. TaxID=1962857 RepID=UPI003D12465F